MTDNNAIVDIDHVMCKVDDIDAGLATLRRLGFRPTPYSRLEMMGGGNSLVLLRARNAEVANFLEVAYTGNPPAATPLMMNILSDGEGVKMVVHMTSAARAYEAWREFGLSVIPPISFERTTHLPTGEALCFKATVVIPEPGQAPLMFNGYETATLHHYRRTDYQEHANGAQHWDAVTGLVAVDEFDKTVAFYERLYGVPAQRGSGIASLARGEVEFRITTPAGLAGRYPGIDVSSGCALPIYVGLTIAVEDPDRLLRILVENGVPHQSVGEAVCVAPRDAMGILFEFVPMRSR